MKVNDYYNLNLKETVENIVKEYKMPETLAKQGNSKVGKGIGMISCFPYHNCIGKTSWCSSKCYAIKGNIRLINANPLHMKGYVKDAWYVYLIYNDPEKLTKLLIETFRNSGYGIYRNFPEGDWFHTDQIAAHKKAYEKVKYTRHFFYTRSWRTELRAQLEDIIRLPNVKGFASSDIDTGSSPKDWLQASILDYTFDTDKRVICPEQMQQVPNCHKCGLCFNKEVKRHIVFFDHGDMLYNKLKKAASKDNKEQLKVLQKEAYERLKNNAKTYSNSPPKHLLIW